MAATNYNCQSGLGVLPPRPTGLRFGQGESPLDVVGMDMLLDISAQWTTIGSGGAQVQTGLLLQLTNEE